MKLIVIFFSILLMTGFLVSNAEAQRRSPKDMKKIEFRESISASRFAVSGGGAINKNGYSILAGLEYIAHYHFTLDATAFHRIENYNNLTFTRTGIMVGVKNSVMGYYSQSPFLNLGGGISLMNQQTEDFESTQSFDPITTGFYLTAEGFYNLGSKCKLVARFDQNFFLSEKVGEGDFLSFYHLGLMLRYKVF